MELNELKLMWQAYDQKLEQSLKLNLRCLEMIQAQKIRSKLRPLLWGRGFELILHTIVIYWLTKFLFTHFFEIQFAVAAIALLTLYLLAFANCLKQIAAIKQIDYSEDILNIQKKLSLLQTHYANYVALTFLCFPIYLAYPLVGLKALGDFDLSALKGNWWTANLIFSVVILPVCIWLYTQISYRNIHKKWVRFIIEKSGGNTIRKTMDFMKEIDEMKLESDTIGSI